MGARNDMWVLGMTFVEVTQRSLLSRHKGAGVWAPTGWGKGIGFNFVGELPGITLPRWFPDRSRGRRMWADWGRRVMNGKAQAGWSYEAVPYPMTLELKRWSYEAGPVRGCLFSRGGVATLDGRMPR